MNQHGARSGWFALAFGLVFACGKGPLGSFDGQTHDVELGLATRVGDAQGTLIFRSEPSGFFPATLSSAVKVTVPAGGEAAANLPISASASTAWVTVKADHPAQISSGSFSLTLDGVQSALVPLPVKWGTVKFASAKTDVQLTVQVVGYFDQSGGGWVADAAAEPKKVQLHGGLAEVTLSDAPGKDPDDTWGRWVLVGESTHDNVAISIGACGSAEVESLVLSKDNVTPVLLPRGKICLGSATSEVSVTLQEAGRFRRFAKTSWRATEPFAVLDTQRGIAWAGVPANGAALDFSLKGVSDLSGAEQVMLVASVEPGTGVVAFGRCDGSGRRIRIDGSTRAIPVTLSDSLCVFAADHRHVRVEVVGTVSPGEVAPAQCPAFPAAPTCAATDLLGRLNCLPGVEAQPKAGTTDEYVLTIVQPVDHARPDGPSFKQRAALRFGGANAPVSLHTTGYNLFGMDSDLASTFQTTEVEVEHRFFGTSHPPVTDFTTMDIVQSAQDSHRIVELLRPVLGNHWVSTGHSKGGMTALFHRRFFPCDVDGTVPYVTPISYGMGDLRYGPFLQQVGGQKYAACRQVFRDLDHGIMADRVRYASQITGTYSKMGGAENALWASVGLTSWTLFQYSDADDLQEGCPAYEATRASPANWQQVVDAYANTAEAYSDEYLASLEQQQNDLFGYLYQTVNELGTQAGTLDHLADLGPVPNFPRPEPFMLGSVPVPRFEPRAMHDIQNWVKAHGNHLLFIYGELDPWSGGAVELGDAKDSAKLVIAGANHGARMSQLSAEDSQKAQEMVSRWFGPRQRLGNGEKVIRHITPKRFQHFMRERGI
ncbi:MAG: hypothetical protein K1X64_17400 [Myxococcaceae bacterium]|nr:hypothetical protein [Myxococcaceae bacterium]